MKIIQRIIVMLLTTLAMLSVATGCSDDKDREVIPENEACVIKDGKIYINLYAPKGMTYAPVAWEELPEFFKSVKEHDVFRDDIVLFAGEYQGELSYWEVASFSSTFFPHLLGPDGTWLDNGKSFKEVDYTKLVCIFHGKNYRFPMIIGGKE